MEDAELVAKARSGDAAAYGALVERYQARIIRLVRGMVPPQDAEDVAQDAFVKAFVKIGSFDGRSQFYTWVHRIASNTAMDWRKREKHRRHAPLPETDDGQDMLPEDAPGPRVRAQRREMAKAIDAAVAELPEKYHEIVLLREVDGLSYEEIAASLGISKGTVESRLFRARERLREKLSGWMES